MGNQNNYPNPHNNPYRISNQPSERKKPVNQQTPRIDFDTNRICPSCGKIISLRHNFCKFCGVDLSGLRPMQDADRAMRELAKTALTDPNADVRREAVDTLGDFGELEVLGVLAYILLNDLDENVRKEAADELGDLHHIISLDVLAKALRDKSPIVRKEAIEGLKKIKKKNKPEKQEAKAELRVEKEEEFEIEKPSEQIEIEKPSEQIEIEKPSEQIEIDEDPNLIPEEKQEGKVYKEEQEEKVYEEEQDEDSESSEEMEEDDYYKL
jgi:hypothetical protein